MVPFSFGVNVCICSREPLGNGNRLKGSNGAPSHEGIVGNHCSVRNQGCSPLCNARQVDVGMIEICNLYDNLIIIRRGEESYGDE